MFHSKIRLAALFLALLMPAGLAASENQSQDKLLDRAYAKAHAAWLAKNYQKGIAWLKPLSSRLGKKRGAKELLAGLHYAQGWKELDARHYHRAKRELEQAARLGPKEKNAWFSLGLVCRALKDRTGSEKNFEKTLKIDPAHFEALLALANIAYEGHHYRKARNYLKRAVKIRPGDPTMLLLKERCSQDQVLVKNFKSFASPHFRIRYAGDIPKTNQDTEKILAHLELCHRELKNILGRAPDKHIEVVLYSYKEFSTLRGITDWMGAFYDGKVRIPLKSWRSRQKKVQELMRHELAHAFVEELLPGASSWLQEGFAQWYQGRRSRGLTNRFRKTPMRGSTELRSVFAKVQDRETVAALYLQSLILIEDLLSRGGSQEVRRLLLATAKGGGSYAKREDKALVEIQGRTLDAWIQVLAKERSWATPSR